ncbi:MAG: phosphoribosylformylglycinamidine synthase subunit PurQ [Bacteroidales bacterium]|nr:phosphoribosylformylglycinamidine synthase subunit PurQ [Bacteroidales bacterium]MDD4235398.1 phosphoribosylformylglycinamidine synthase subunit PurQ [Bacteroidales bacterium]
MKFGVIVFPGSNCDHDMIYSLGEILRQEVVPLWHKEVDLKSCDIIALPGGFSYGDYLRSGSIARFSPIMDEVINFANKGGFVFGVCNGFQILCEAGLLPGALLHNVNQKFICKNQYIKPEHTDTAMSLLAKSDEPLKIPIAHGEGRYFATKEVLSEMITNGQIVWRYCDADGSLTEASNPNGSIMNIAGVCNKNKNVFGMMPHPERATDPELGNTDGKVILESIIKSFN